MTLLHCVDSDESRQRQRQRQQQRKERLRTHLCTEGDPFFQTILDSVFKMDRICLLITVLRCVYSYARTNFEINTFFKCEVNDRTNKMYINIVSKTLDQNNSNSKH